MKRFTIRLAIYLGFLVAATFIIAFVVVSIEKIFNTKLTGGSEIAPDLMKLGTGILATWGWVKLMKVDFSTRNQLNRVSMFGWGAIVGGLSIILSVVFVLPFNWLHLRTEIQPFGDILLLSFVGSVSAGFSEEIVFRGILYPLLNDVLPKWISALITGMLFAAGHLILNRYNNVLLPPLYYTMAGLLFTLAWEFGGLWYAIGVHFGLDLAVGKVGVFASSTAPGWIAIDGGFADWTPLLLLSCVLFTQLRNRATKMQTNSPK